MEQKKAMNENKNRQQNLKNNECTHTQQPKIKGFFPFLLISPMRMRKKKKKLAHTPNIIDTYETKSSKKNRSRRKRLCNFNQPQYLRAENVFFFFIFVWFFKWEQNKDHSGKDTFFIFWIYVRLSYGLMKTVNAYYRIGPFVKCFSTSVFEFCFGVFVLCFYLSFSLAFLFDRHAVFCVWFGTKIHSFSNANHKFWMKS